EDPLDDCPNDNVDRKHDVLFNGRASMFQETKINGTWNAHTGSMVVAENNTGIASGNEQFVFNSNSVNWQSTYSSSSLLSATESANEVLVLDDGYLTERFTCQAIGTGTSKTYMRMFSYVWVPLNDNDIANPSSVIGGIVESPYGDGVDGKWVAYGKAGFGGASTSTTLLSGWAVGIDAGQVASGTNAGNNGKGILNNEVKKEVIMGEGYYKISCVASQEQTTSAGQATFAQFEISQTVWAVELCSDGTSPLRNEATDVDYPFTCASSGGGGDVGSAANDFWDALTDSFFALGVLVAFVAGAAALWFIDRKNAAVGLALIGIGVASAFFVREVDLETSTQEVWGTIAHLLIAGGIFWSFFPYQDMPGKTAAVSLFIGVWGLIHALDNTLEDGVSLGGLEDYLIPAIPGAAVLLASVGLVLGIYATAVQFQVVDDFTGLIEED
ncbi:MAG: hypothetical protein VXV89_07375, partial [Candidatus Thermoplasmatota archaeon]|nr:hypothetical protein [Candidatus Thermoplasmatota archaeon]